MYPCVQHFCFHVFPLYYHLFNLCKFCPVVQYCLRISFLASNFVICILVIFAFARLVRSRAIYVFTCVLFSFSFFFLLHETFSWLLVSQWWCSKIYQQFSKISVSISNQESDVSTDVEICRKHFIFFESFILHRI